MKEKHDRIFRKGFISLKTSNVINNVWGQNQSVNIAALSFFVDLIVDDKKIEEHFNLIFSNLGQYFGRKYEGAPIYKDGDESFSFCPTTEKFSMIF